MSGYSNYLGSKKCCTNNLLKTVTWPQGLKGEQGPIGQSGYQGVTGAQGIRGATGACCIGPTGAQWLRGATGAQGYNGFQGNTGSQGVTGTQGAQGITGPQGATGSSNPNATAITITDTNTNATFYPTFVGGSIGFQPLYADITTTPLTYNPGTGFLTTRYLYNQVYYFAQKTYSPTQTYGTTLLGNTLTLGTAGSGSGLPAMLTSATSIVLPVGLAGWYRATGNWVVPSTQTNLSQYFMSIINTNTVFNILVTTADYYYTNGGSGFGAVQGGGCITGVFNCNSAASDAVILQLINPSVTMSVSSVSLTVEFIGGNI